MPTTVTAVHIAPATRLPMQARTRVEAEAGKGLVGDRYHGTRHRHVTVQSETELALAESDFGQPIDPALTRRNITVSDGTMPRTPGHRWLIGSVELEVVRDAAPCKVLDFELGDGARATLRRRAGVVCRVLSDGTISIGDVVTGMEEDT